MTEKRFTETISTGIIKDNQTGIEYSCEMRIDDDFLNLVNTISGENEELKKEVKQLKNKIKTYNSTHELLKETIDRLRSDG